MNTNGICKIETTNKPENINILPNILNLNSSESISTSTLEIPSTFEGDHFDKKAQQVKVCDEQGIFLEAYRQQGNLLTGYNQETVKNRLSSFFNEPVTFLSFEKGYNNQPFSMTFTPQDILDCCGLGKSEHVVIPGSGLYYLAPQMPREVMKSINVDTFFSEEYWQYFEYEIRQTPSDFDIRIYLQEDQLKIKESFFKKIVEHLAHKFILFEEKELKNDPKKIEKLRQWAKGLLTKKLNTKQFPTTKKEFWALFIENFAFSEKPITSWSKGMNIFALGNRSDKIFEFIFLDDSDRCLTNFTASALEMGLNGEIRLNKKIKNDFNYCPRQCLKDKITKTVRSVYKNDFSDVKNALRLILSMSRNCRTLDSETQKKKAENFFNEFLKTGKIENLINSMEKYIKKHLGGKKDFYLPFAINAFLSLEKFEEKTRLEILSQFAKKIEDKPSQTILPKNNITINKKSPSPTLIEKTDIPPLSESTYLLKNLIEKYPFHVISAYFQLIGFINMLVMDHKHSPFQTILHNGNICWQIRFPGK